MDNWIQEVIAKWKSEGVKLGPPASISDIEKVESVFNFKLPIDFKEFYLACNGFADLDWQKNMFTLWPLEMMVEEYKDSRNQNFVGFSDFLLASHFIGFNKDRTGVFKSYQYLEDGELIAETFEEVIMMINSGSDRVY
jgi:hypothetical protein